MRISSRVFVYTGFVVTTCVFSSLRRCCLVFDIRTPFEQIYR